MRWLRRVYRAGARDSPWRTASLTLGGGAWSAARGDRVAGSRSGLEFLPKLEEGNFWIRATMPASISLEDGNGYVNRMRELIKGFPEVETVISQHGRPDDGTDATGFFNAEFFVPLKPFDAMAGGRRQGQADRRA